ncbi:hypothetical protein B0H11DRAFT_2400847 [Mycena galericulata]|nr:hypothetical protein B0H11DRAFT_2400847 [Mycena galericulata]
MYLENLRKELADLEISITRQRSLLEQLEERKATVRAEIDAFIFPVLTLPPEITTEIFLQYAFGTHRELEDNLGCLFQNVFRLLAVCRVWRTLALSVPALWATLDVGSRPLDRNHAPGEMEEIVDTWFSRAGALPLFLNWFGATVDPWSGQINTVIRRHAPRLQTLRLCIHSGCVSHLIDGITFPHLQSLDLSNLDRATASTPLPTPVLTFREATQLRHVALERVSPSSLTLPWGLLNIFSANSISPQECLDVLRAAPELHTFDYYGSDGDDSFNDDEPVVLHTRLTSFRLCNGNQDILRYLALPALENLDFGNVPGLRQDLFIPFLLRSRGSLRNFELSFTAPLVLSMQWFQHMMHLTSLDLPDLQSHSRTNFVWALNRQHDREFLPTLENLTFTDWKPDHVDTELLDALHTRCIRIETKDGHVHLQLKLLQLMWVARYPGATIPTLDDIRGLVERHGVALRDLQICGTGIHVGTEDKNYI